MKDIFVDTNLAIHLTNPLSDPFKDFVKWLYEEGVLVINNQLQTEFIKGNQTLASIIDNLTRYGRLNRIEPNHLKKLRFSKKQEKGFLSNQKDRVHLKSVLLSSRKMALSKDANFMTDINSFNKMNGIQPHCEDCPSKIAYQ